MIHYIFWPHNGEFLVGYHTPGCINLSFTIHTVCRTVDSAQREVERLNGGQELREIAIAHERQLCGLGRASNPDLINVIPAEFAERCAS